MALPTHGKQKAYNFGVTNRWLNGCYCVDIALSTMYVGLKTFYLQGVRDELQRGVRKDRSGVLVAIPFNKFNMCLW